MELYLFREGEQEREGVVGWVAIALKCWQTPQCSTNSGRALIE